MKRLLLLILLTLSSTTFANQEICSDLQEKGPLLEVTSCLEILEGSTIQDEALNLCMTHKNSVDVNDCLFYSIDSKFDTDALALCHRHTDSESKNDCVEIVKNAKFEKASLEECAEVSQKETHDLNFCIAIKADANLSLLDLFLGR